MFLLRSLLSFLCSLILVTKSYCIVGGNEVSIKSLPYVVSIRDTANNHYCGGTIISASNILTAANCVYDKKPLEVFVFIRTIDNLGSSRYNVSRIVAHNEFNPQNKQNDIALLEINGVITFNENVQPIKLSTTSPTDAGTRVTVSVLGLVGNLLNGLSNTLQSLIATTISIIDCQKQMPEFQVFETNICTKRVSGQGACHGDMGGPLFDGSKQIGIVSWGIPCAVGKPDVFTSIYAYRKWLEQQTVGKKVVG